MDAVSVCVESQYVCACRRGTVRRNFSRCCLTMPGCVDGPLGRREVEQQSDSAVAQAKSAITTRHTTPRPETMTAHKSKVTGERTREREIKRNVLCIAWAFINLRKTPEDNFICSVHSAEDQRGQLCLKCNINPTYIIGKNKTRKQKHQSINHAVK